MQRIFFAKGLKTAALLVVSGLFAAGCGAKTGKTARTYYDNMRFVPSIHVENNSFGVNSAKYMGCSYDMMHDGYWCPVSQ